MNEQKLYTSIKCHVFGPCIYTFVSVSKKAVKAHLSWLKLNEWQGQLQGTFYVSQSKYSAWVTLQTTAFAIWFYNILVLFVVINSKLASALWYEKCLLFFFFKATLSVSSEWRNPLKAVKRYCVHMWEAVQSKHTVPPSGLGCYSHKGKNGKQINKTDTKTDT